MHITPMDESAARTISTWRYSGPYAMYNMAGPEDIPYLLANDYYAIYSATHHLIGYCCFGAEARVAGGNYQFEAVDIGMGLPPQNLGEGLGTNILPYIEQYAYDHFDVSRLRATVAVFNTRAQRLCLGRGFVQTRTFSREDGRAFMILVKE